MRNRKILKNFIVFEGLDGAGTTTQVSLLRSRYYQNKIACVQTAEPTDSFLGQTIRRVLGENEKITYGALARLFVADRFEHLYGPQGIISNFDKGTPVICDRYLFSSLAYQSIDRKFEEIDELNKGFPLPEYLFFIKTPIEECQKRIHSRDGKKEIYENILIQEKIEENYQRALKQYVDSGMKIFTLNGTYPPEVINKAVWCSIHPEYSDG